MTILSSPARDIVPPSRSSARQGTAGRLTTVELRCLRSADAGVGSEQCALAWEGLEMRAGFTTHGEGIVELLC